MINNILYTRELHTMASKKPRINVTFEEEISAILIDLADQEKKSVASLVRELTLEGLDMREDRYLSDLAERRDQEGVKTYSHDEAWK